MKDDKKYAFSVVMNEDRAEEKLAEIMASKMTLTDFESKSIKTIIPQCVASLIACALNTIVGLSLAYSGILIPAIESPDSDIKVTKGESSWIASTTTLVIAFTCTVIGPIMDKIGRINTIKVSVIPMVGGWLIIAFAKNVTMLIIGRILAGAAGALAPTPAVVYISEIARPDLRGTLTSVLTLCSSIGIELVYLESTIMNWRTLAWSSAALVIVPFILLFTIQESPIWLMSKGREEDAKKALKWLHKYYKPKPHEQDIVEVHFSILKKERDLNKEIEEQNEKRNVMLDFLKPTGYKPMLILLGLFIVQQFSGAYVIIFYAVTFFQGVGSNVNPLLASNLVAGSTVVMSVINIFTLKIFGKKPLMLVSSMGMGIFLFISGLYTKWIQEGTTELKWVPLVCLFAFMVVAMIGLMPVPWTMMAEVFPLQLRGVATSLIGCISGAIMFFAIQSFRTLNDVLGGSVGVQYFYGTVCFAGVIYIYFLVPETKGKKLSEIEEYFK